MKLSIQYTIVAALFAVAILVFKWGALLIALFAVVGYLWGAHREGSLDIQAAFKALTGNTKTKSD
ncbi:hypothetical protein [Boudabousia marimammalium]|uniref:DUF2273 domain-containing protein n=1 Tax=Boudabousia marimammalium TaxID=156892 RepID=A0A1Q5PT39_9ACTO|nr:hypothetical protein [Boudabousia marimammalium]OKL50615.1 hypothetical protein BM477_01270 [Boudabousia marimammalium]